MPMTEAILGMATVTCEIPEEVSHMKATGQSQSETRGRRVSLAKNIAWFHTVKD